MHTLYLRIPDSFLGFPVSFPTFFKTAFDCASVQLIADAQPAFLTKNTDCVPISPIHWPEVDTNETTQDHRLAVIFQMGCSGRYRKKANRSLRFCAKFSTVFSKLSSLGHFPPWFDCRCNVNESKESHQPETIEINIQFRTSKMLAVF